MRRARCATGRSPRVWALSVVREGGALRIGVTGHMNLSGETPFLVANALRTRLKGVDRADLVGVTCLAPGADSVFAEVIVELGGRLEVFLPSADYRHEQVPAGEVGRFDAVIAAADVVTILPFDTAGPRAYAAANEAMLSAVDELIAVWDGTPSPDHGGTAGAVAEARSRNLPVVVIWPSGAERA